MFKNYLKIALRNIKRHMGYSSINISGLAIGMACCILILLWIQDELSFDRFHHNTQNIYRVVCEEHDTAVVTYSPLTPPPLANALKSELPEITHASRFGGWGTWLVRYGDKKFNEPNYECVDPDFFKIFSFSFLKGNPEKVLEDLYSVVITESMAEKYFSNEDPMGKTLRINNQFDVKVTGVIKDIPTNSTIKFDFISPFQIVLKEFLKEKTGSNWNFNSFNTFVMIKETTNGQELISKLKGFFKKRKRVDNDELIFQPLKEMRLYSNPKYGFDGGGNIKYVKIFSLLAFFVLFIACINFMNLSTARSAKRAKEVGLRKVIGAKRSQLIRQFFGESILMSFLALILAIVIVEILLPLFNNLSGKNLSINFLDNISIYFGFIGIVIFTGIISGSYPALLLSSFQPIKILKGFLKSGGSSRFRKILVTTQFILTIFLMIGTAVISKQLRYIKNKDLGYNKEQVIYIRMPGKLNEKYYPIKNKLLQNPHVINVSGSLALPTDNHNSPGSPLWEGKDPKNKMIINADFVDFDFIETLQVEMVQGRSFSREFSTDSKSAYIVNEEAVRQMGLDSPVGKQFSFWDNKGTIIGVMKDFHFQPLRNKITPMAFKIFPAWFGLIYVRIKPGNISTTIDSIKNSWDSLNKDYPFEYRFLDKEFEKLYKSEERMEKIFNYFTLLGLFIACLGLLGLSAFIAEQRTKEIGIRKVLGASVSNITIMLSRQVSICVLIANIIALPVAYIVMNKWLTSFAYRMQIGIGAFIMSGTLAIIIAILTVSYQSIKAAVANPAEALHHE